MKFRLELEIEPSKELIEPHQSLVFLGSCFADEIGSLATVNGLNAISNPFGTLFHPKTIASHLNRIINPIKASEIIESEILYNKELYFHWNSHPKFYSSTKEELIQKILAIDAQILSALQSHNAILFLTLGTSKAYLNNSGEFWVGNCHKLPSTEFRAEIWEKEAMRQELDRVLTQLLQLNPSIKIVFTISPVRHSKDGLVENNLSKARLLDLVHTMINERASQLSYFPAYEWVIDDLRDYRFYKEDLVHPNDIAINYIWNHWVNTYASANTKKFLQLISSYNTLKNHKPVITQGLEFSKYTEALQKLETQIAGFKHVN